MTLLRPPDSPIQNLITTPTSENMSNIYFSRERRQLMERLLLADPSTSRPSTTCNQRLRIHNLTQKHYDFFCTEKYTATNTTFAGLDSYSIA